MAGIGWNGLEQAGIGWNRQELARLYYLLEFATDMLGTCFSYIKHWAADIDSNFCNIVIFFANLISNVCE